MKSDRKVPAEPWTCSRCGRLNSPRREACKSCGTTLGDPTASGEPGLRRKRPGNLATLIWLLLWPIPLFATCVAVDTGSDYLLLAPLAEQHGTSRSKSALVLHVTGELEERIGQPRSEIHAHLASIGGSISIQSHGRQPAESVYWEMAARSGGWKIWAIWILDYDASDRLAGVTIGDSP